MLMQLKVLEIVHNVTIFLTLAKTKKFLVMDKILTFILNIYQ